MLDSGFLPVGPRGETYLRLDVSGGSQINNPPLPPLGTQLVRRAGGVVRIVATYAQTGGLRAGEWAISYTVNGVDPGTPPAVAPSVTVAMGTSAMEFLSYDLPAQAHGTTVKVRMQTRRNDSGTWRYSEGSTVLTSTADATGPTAAQDGKIWPGKLPDEI